MLVEKQIKQNVYEALDLANANLAIIEYVECVERKIFFFMFPFLYLLIMYDQGHDLYQIEYGDQPG